MGALMHFYAVRAGEALREGARAAADFSLHIGDDELDELLAAACEHARVERIAWSAAAEPLSDSAHKMTPAFVELFAGLAAGAFVQAARPWLGRALTPDFERAIGELIDTCRRARDERLDVVFIVSP